MAHRRYLNQPLRSLAAGAFLCTMLSGCTVIAVGAAAVSATATVVGVAADVAVGSVKLVGKGVGAAYDAATDDKPDNSGITIKYRDPSAMPAAPEASATPPSTQTEKTEKTENSNP